MSIDAEPTTRRWLSGTLEPVHDELDVDGLEVEGELPAGLEGTYLRNGPNPQFDPIGRYHLFDGDGMLHDVRIQDGTARYRNRWLESRGLVAERKRGKACYGGLSEFVFADPDVLEEGGMLKNTANTHVVRHADRTFALMEAAPPTQVDPATLETLGEHDFGGLLQGPMTAHPKLDPDTGEMLFFGYSPFPPFLRFHTVDAAGTLVRSVEVEIPNAVMMHDFAVTRQHAVFFDLPAIFDVHALMAGEGAISWKPEHGARIGVLPRSSQSGDDVRWFEIDPCYVFHFLNAWESADGRTITVVGCRNARLPLAFGPEELDAPVHPMLHRWVIDLDAGTVADEQLDDRPADFPRVSPAHETKAVRYGYLAGSEQEHEFDGGFDVIAKYDLESGTNEVHRFGPGLQGGEPVFAPNPDGTAEDDGWLLDLVVDKATRRTQLWLLDAADVTAAPLAKVTMPRRVPPGFHGSWMPGLTG
jgi:carotenoid cleavage dioxygenase